MSRFYWLQIGSIGIGLSFALLLAIITAPIEPSVHKTGPETPIDQIGSQTNFNDSGYPDFRFYETGQPNLEYGGDPSESQHSLFKNNIALLDFDEANLLAQERVAHWTAWIGAFTAIGLFAILATLIETRRVTAVTREIGQKQIRAYLHIDSILLDDRSSDASGGVRLCISAHNSGQSRAVAPVATYTMTAFDNDRILTGLVEFPPIESGQTKIRWDFVNFEDLSSLISETSDEMHFVYLKSCLSYDDVFGQSDRVYSAAIMKFGWEEEEFIHIIEESPLVDKKLIYLADVEHNKIVDQYRQRMKEKFESMQSST